ncbi:MAG: KH domain-containing protein [Bacilli bacterium]|nr:KH domain-containing protein [Bacilli bacterium]
MELLIRSLVKPLVDHPEDIQVERREEGNKIVYHLLVNEDDIGKVIGKNGRVANAIRTIVYSANSDETKRVYLDIM